MAESKAISSDTLVQVQQGFVYNPHRRYSAFGYLWKNRALFAAA